MAEQERLIQTLPPGTFLDLGVSQPSSDPHFTGATPAYYYQGLGISCDVLSGYHKTGEMVGYNGSGDPGGDPYMAKNQADGERSLRRPLAIRPPDPLELRG